MVFFCAPLSFRQCPRTISPNGRARAKWGDSFAGKRKRWTRTDRRDGFARACRECPAEASPFGWSAGSAARNRPCACWALLPFAPSLLPFSLSAFFIAQSSAGAQDARKRVSECFDSLVFTANSELHFSGKKTAWVFPFRLFRIENSDFPFV